MWVAARPNKRRQVYLPPANCQERLQWYAALLYVRDDPSSVGFCELKDRLALDTLRLLPSWRVLFCELRRHRGGSAVSAHLHAFGLNLHTNGAGAIERTLVPRITIPHSRPCLT